MKKIIFADYFDYSLIKEVGFDGIFIKYGDKENVYTAHRNAVTNGLILSSIHAPSKYCNYIYTDNPTPYYEQLKEIISIAGELKIPYVITHASLQIDTPPYDAIAIERYKTLCDFAFSKGVTICVENIEHDYAVYLNGGLIGYNGYGFCLDTGHNNAYTPTIDYSPFKPTYLHLNDNIGMTGETYATIDDLHLIPYDGTFDFDKVCAQLKAQNYDGHLTLELKKHNTHLYDNLSDREYLEKAFNIACELEKKITNE